MKTVIVLSGEKAHRLIYHKALEKHFRVEVVPGMQGSAGRIDAVVYDMPHGHKPADTCWLEKVSFPVVVLTSETSPPVPDRPNIRVLTYPVRGAGVLVALAELGVRPDP